MLTIEIGSSNDYQKLFTFLRENKLSSKEVLIDLTNHGFLKPPHILTIITFVIYFKRKGYLLKLKYPSNLKIQSYLESIRITDFTRTNYIQPTALEFNDVNSSMPIMRISAQTMLSYIQATNNYFSRICPTKDVSMLGSCISELINNVTDHSKSEIDAYIFCQYYPIKNEIVLCVADLGVGIPCTVNGYLRKNNLEMLSSQDCLKWAIVEKNTSKSKENNFGLGLSLMVDFIVNSESKLKIFSHDAALLMNKQSTRTSINPIINFKGTIIEITININGLDEKSDNYFDFDDV